MRELTIVVPAFNEERRLPRLLAFLEQEADETARAAGLQLSETIIVDDGSTDRTRAVLEQHRGLRMRVISHETNRGKGAAVRSGILATQTPLALVMDVDLSTPPSYLVPLATAIEQGADVAIGSRALSDSDIVVRQPAFRELMGKAFNRLFRLATGLSLRDTQCGFKLFLLQTTRVLFEEQQIEGFAFDAEILVRAERRGLEVVELPVSWSNDPATSVKLFGSSGRMALDLLRIAGVARARGGRPRTSYRGSATRR